MTPPDIDRHFRALGLDSGASFAQVKEARSWYTKAFHPDRFAKGSKDVTKAEEKQKEINLAFEELRRWFQGETNRTGHPATTTSQASRRGQQKSARWQAELNRYAQSLQESDKSPATVKNSYCDLRTFASWLTEARGDAWDLHGIDVEEVVSGYAGQLFEGGYKLATIARHLYSIRGFLAFAGVDIGFVISLASEYKAEVRPLTVSLTEKQLASFLAVIDRDAIYDDEALVRFLLHTGVSVSELCALKWKDLSFANVPGHRRKCVMINVAGRSGNRRIPLNDFAVHALTVLGFNGVLPSKGKLSATNIFSREACEMTPKMVHYVVDRYAKIAHVPVTPSILRNTFCKKLAKSGVPLEHLAKLIGLTEQSASVYYVSAGPDMADLLAAVDLA